MTGTANVNNLPAVYQVGTMLILLFFAIYDILHHKVRNAALLAFLPWCLSYIFLSLMFDIQPVGMMVCRSLLGFMSGGLLLLSASLLTNGGIGGGDIKITALLGILYGTTGILLVVVTASMAALMIHNFITAIRHTQKKDLRIPFVPYLLFGALLTLFIL